MGFNKWRERDVLLSIILTRVDTGDIIEQSSVKILDQDNILSLTFKLAEFAPNLPLKVVKTLRMVNSKETSDSKRGSYYSPRLPEDGEMIGIEIRMK